MTITLTVAGRIATVEATTHVVAGNTYPVTLSLDSEWTGSLYLRVRFGSLYYDIPFSSSDTSVDVQMPVGYPEVGIGVYSEALEICSNETRVRLLRSILEAGEQVVEFDSDLYDQWAGEVTTLLTDDAFDAESTRPVQNAVLTAWKNTVPLDSALVHKTGAETIAGGKIFTNTPTVRSNSTTVLNLESMADSSASTTRARFSILSNGTERGRVFQYKNQSVEQMGIRQYRVDTSGFFDMTLTATADGRGYVTVPTFTADNNADDKVVTRSMLAQTPTVVHTTGNETVAGAKTFTSLLTASNVQVKDASTPTVTMLKGSDEVASLASDGTQAGLTASSQFFGLRGLGTAPFGQAPSYTADNSADGKIVTRSMLASSPTVVHTTGSETIAGTKTFNSAVHAPPWMPLTALGWTKLFEFGTSTKVIFEMTSGASIIKCLATKTGALNVSILSSTARPYTDCIKRATDGNGNVSIWFNALYGAWARGYVIDIGANTATVGSLDSINILNSRIADGPTEAGGYTSIATGTPFEVVS